MASHDTPPPPSAAAEAGTPALAPATSSHQVVIVGGGITGLALALMLQQLNVDYVLLEAYATVTPQQGASIGLHANGLRILDQLGLLPAIEAVAVLTTTSTWRDSNRGGRRIMARDAGSLMRARHGYGNYFMSRHELLCVLEAAVRDKDRLLVNTRVCRVEDSDEAGSVARVHTTDGRVFEAQMVVGADGVRSFVRAEMWRHAEEREKKAAAEQQPPSPATEKPSKKTKPPTAVRQPPAPWSIPASDKGPVPCEHACLFGTARPKPGISPGDLIAACGTRSTAGLMGAANGDVFFFWFWTLPHAAGQQNTCPVTEIPRITPAEEAHELERCRDTIVTDAGLTMGEVLGDVYDIGATALPHFVLDRWSSGGRVVVLGDAAHKFNPLVGQGGNSCIESCAALVNLLQKHVLPQSPALSEKPAMSSSSPAAWSRESLTAVFAALEAERVPRVRDMVDKCQEAMHRVAWDSWKPKVLQRYIAPLLPLSVLADFYTVLITPGLRLRGSRFEDPTALEHSVPWDDEKVEKKKTKKDKSGGVKEKTGAVKVASTPLAAVAAA
ncbi:hypothetical protein Micbo1qcDRAFT_165865 [Microdochium bolleyi]|uniref:FAD-binding domain-containing protein n=1 Tax=Microdochium bolleyi TaxID=196109 RepID=A0A136IW37_9PEZI|nr:hypothetical protein Micbo1qcDRAFT_165865 [Microdochium bolleyi]